MVLAMTMVMGLNLTALTYQLNPLPEGCPESVTPCTHSEADREWNLYYVYQNKTTTTSAGLNSVIDYT